LNAKEENKVLFKKIKEDCWAYMTNISPNLKLHYPKSSYREVKMSRIGGLALVIL